MMYNDENWEWMVLEVSKRFNVTADFNFMLFLIGIHEHGQGMRSYSREEKMDLIDLAKCILLSQKGYLQPKASDAEGWPQFEKLKKMEELSPSGIQHLLKQSAFEYLQARMQ